MSHAVSSHCGWDELVDYWADEHSDPDAVELHTMGCQACTDLSARIAAVTTMLGKLLPPLLSPELLAKLHARGLRIGEASFQPGDRRELRFPRDRDLMVIRLEGLPADVARLDFAMITEQGAPLAQLDNVPFAQGAALLACQQHYASLPPDVVVRLQATHRDGRRSETRYTILHRFERP